MSCNSAGSQTTGCPCRGWCTAHLQTDSRWSYHCPAAMSQCCRTGKISVLAHKLLITPSISCSPDIRPQNTSQQHRARCNSFVEAELHPCLLLFSSLCSRISSPPSLSFLHPIPSAPKAVEETQHRSPVVVSHRKAAGDAAGSLLWGGKRQVLNSAAEQETLENKLKILLLEQQTHNSSLSAKPHFPKAAAFKALST